MELGLDCLDARPAEAAAAAAAGQGVELKLYCLNAQLGEAVAKTVMAQATGEMQNREAWSVRTSCKP